MIRPTGLVRIWDVVYGFDPDEVGDRIEAWCATAGIDDTGDWSHAELEEHIRDESSTFTWLLEPMIRRCGFESCRVPIPTTGSSPAISSDRPDHQPGRHHRLGEEEPRQPQGGERQVSPEADDRRRLRRGAAPRTWASAGRPFVPSNE